MDFETATVMVLNPLNVFSFTVFLGGKFGIAPISQIRESKECVAKFHNRCL